LTATRTGVTYPIRVHATNISGLGATQLVQSLLPAIEKMDDYDIRIIYLPACVRCRRTCPMATRLVRCAANADCPMQFPGRLNALSSPVGSRAREAAGARRYPPQMQGKTGGIRADALLTSSAAGTGRLGAIKFRIARWLFALNAKYASAFIVQSEAMKQALLETYPQVAGRIHVILQPPPRWLVDSALKRTGQRHKRPQVSICSIRRLSILTRTIGS